MKKKKSAAQRGPRGLRGPAGPIGPVGPQGPRGKTGPAGKGAPLDSVEAVTAHIEKLDQELRIQLQRIAQIQVELDEARAAIKRLSERPGSTLIPDAKPSSESRDREH